MTNLNTIGRTIAALRKEKGVTQEGLARFVGVSTQAVSKWENGGVPDTDLLPRIADYFQISIDRLFGRTTPPDNLTAAIFRQLRNTPPDSYERFKRMFEICWDMERSLFCFGGKVDAELLEGGSINEYERSLSLHEQQYSSVMSDHGFTRMGIANRLQYFLCVPEIQHTQSALLQNVDYPAFFSHLADRDIFAVLLFLFGRENAKAFTPNLLVQELNLEPSKAHQVLQLLLRYRLVRMTSVEGQETAQEVYHFCPTPSFVALLIFSREMIDPPDHFAFFSDGRNKPYL